MKNRVLCPQLRPVSDLKNTLLHEMIHAELFLEGIKDRGDHGPKFQGRMNTINKATCVDPQVCSAAQDLQLHIIAYTISQYASFLAHDV